MRGSADAARPHRRAARWRADKMLLAAIGPVSIACAEGCGQGPERRLRLWGERGAGGGHQHKSGLATVTTTWKQLAREYSLGLQV